MGEGGIINHAPTALPLGKQAPRRRLDGQNRQACGRDDKFISPPGI